MSVCIYFNPPAMTAAEYRSILATLESDGEWPPAGLEHHSCFGEEGHLMVYEVWASPEQMEAFGQRLMPVIASAGLDPGEPMVMPVENVIQPS